MCSNIHNASPAPSAAELCREAQTLAISDTVSALACLPIALTTFERRDESSANRLQTAIARGDDELLFWGLGPRLRVGDLVAMYSPDSVLIPKRDRKAISRVYPITRILEGTEWPNYVFLSRPLVFDPFELPDLKKAIGLTAFEIRDAGSTENPWGSDRARNFWTFVLNRQPNLAESVRERLFVAQAQGNYDVALSYGGPDWTEARRLKRWLEHEDLKTFFATSVGPMGGDGAGVLTELLRETYRDATVAVFLVPPSGFVSPWISIELESALEGSGRVVLARLDPSREWPIVEADDHLRIDYAPPYEGEIVKLISRLAKKTARS